MKISLEQVLKNSKLRLAGGPDAGKTVLERNFERMKTWKKSEVEELFDENNSLKKRGSKETQDDHKTLVSSRKLICTSLKMIIDYIFLTIFKSSIYFLCAKLQFSGFAAYFS